MYSILFTLITFEYHNILIISCWHRRDVIPVAYGLGYEHYNLPAHSYIDVLNFTSIRELGEYLQYLDKNDTAYNEYFRWLKR